MLAPLDVTDRPVSGPGVAGFHGPACGGRVVGVGPGSWSAGDEPFPIGAREAGSHVRGGRVEADETVQVTVMTTLPRACPSST